MEMVNGGNMRNEFSPPDFSRGDLELRFEEDEICIYASEKGLKRLIDLCESLIEKPGQGHIHLEDYEVLTTESLKGTIGIFPSS